MSIEQGNRLFLAGVCGLMLIIRLIYGRHAIISLPN